MNTRTVTYRPRYVISTYSEQLAFYSDLDEALADLRVRFEAAEVVESGPTWLSIVIRLEWERVKGEH